MNFKSTKTWGNDVGLSCCFRQWRASHSHCRFLHGYSIGVRLIFSASGLDEKNWVYDFGDAKWIKAWLQDQFDHKTVVAKDDPEMSMFVEMQSRGLVQLTVLEAVGCEKFAEHIMAAISPKIFDQSQGRVRLESVEVFEHGSNSAMVVAA